MSEGKTFDEALKDALIQASIAHAKEKMKKPHELTPYEKFMREFRELPDLPEHNQPIE